MKTIYRLSIPVVMVAVLSGCHQGQNASTTIQDETGNGIEMVAGDIQMEAVTIVAGERGEVGSLSAVVVNSGTEADRLDAIVIDGRSAVLNPDGLQIAPQTSVSISTKGQMSAQAPLGAAQPGDFVEVTFRYAKSGEATDQVLIVPPVGYYESAAPKVPAAPQG